MRTALTFLAATCAIAACTGFTTREDSTATATTTGSGGAGTGAAGTGAGTSSNSGGSGAGGSVNDYCPESPPSHGGACDPPTDQDGLPFAHCTYGGDLRPWCRKSALCDNDGKWQVTEPDSSCNESPLPAVCGTTPPAQESTCEGVEGTTCWYNGGGWCVCSGCVGGSEYPLCVPVDPPAWACFEAPQGCPDTIPNAGDPCTQEGQNCGPDCELPVVCKNGAWVWLQQNCPMCASPDTPIATPSGDRPIASLRGGDLVYSVHDNAIVAVPIALAESTRVTSHRVMRVILESGAVLEISPGHPTADARTFGDLSAGDRLDTERIQSIELVPYAHDRTHDILPQSDSGTYFVAGELIGSTLH